MASDRSLWHLHEWGGIGLSGQGLIFLSSEMLPKLAEGAEALGPMFRATGASAQEW